MVTKTWFDALRAAGLAPTLRTALEMGEPLLPLVAQLLWAAQPLASVWTKREQWSELATLLETPEGVAQLCALLDAPDDPA